eukprot:NODE_1817_length_1372_cov_27.967068_g1725_i0.p1 GENE.NODE_1817_length_1372_cov_27.967068_g1725_i0~~NODE_1817_length_1372_cov_27.967068_g1725_i0.p1  ORF type:complete len:400 (+),score=83.72 NODE_1817_length_1372_cov_27.967068_g1725_i0:75-1274(+)
MGNRVVSQRHAECIDALEQLDLDTALQLLRSDNSYTAARLERLCRSLLQIKPYLPDALFDPAQASEVSPLTPPSSPFPSRPSSSWESVPESKSIAQGQPSLNLSLGMACRSVTLVCVHLGGFSEFVALHSTEHRLVESRLVDFMDQAFAIIKSHSGVIDRFIDARIYISWNAAAPAPSHITLAAQCATELRDVVKAFTSDEPTKVVTQFKLYIAMVTDVMIVGNTGTHENSWRQFLCLGPTHTLLTQLLMLARQRNVPILMTETCRTRLDNLFQLRPIQTIRFREAINIVYELMHPLNLDDNEWMYQIAQQETTDTMKYYKESYLQFCQGMFLKAMDSLRRHEEAEEGNADDPVTLSLRTQIQFLQENGILQPPPLNLTPYIQPSAPGKSTPNNNLETF